MTNGSYKIDLHMHTTVSDGTDTPRELLRNVKAAGITHFSVTDHDAIKAGGIISGLRTDGDPLFIPGVELSCRDEYGKYHILGYGFDLGAKPINGIVERGHGLRMKKVTTRLDLLKSQFGFSFPDEEIEKLLSLDNPGKPHIGNLMVKYGYAETKEQAIHDHIDRVRFKSEYIGPAEAIESITESGGVTVLAHPFYGSGDELILGEDMENRIRRLTGYGLRGIEAYYSGFSEKLKREALALAQKYGLFVTAGSDYHGTNKLVKLGDTGLCSESEYPDGLRRFLDLFE